MARRRIDGGTLLWAFAVFKLSMYVPAQLERYRLWRSRERGAGAGGATGGGGVDEEPRLASIWRLADTVRTGLRGAVSSRPPSAAELARARLEQSINGLRTSRPELSACRTVSTGQRRVLLVVAGSSLVALMVAPRVALIAPVALVTALYVATFVYRILLFYRSLTSKSSVISVSDEWARAIHDSELPVYTVLVPAYREPEVIGRLLQHIEELEYPRHLLDVKILLEEDDEATLEAVLAHETGPHIEIVVVPAAEPRTKPKACNYGLTLARGTLVTIYDAEDRPEPLQLRRAAAAFKTGGPSLACLQARLTFYNAEQNLLTKWFAAEYAMWFGNLLPGLISLGAPIPLGGTSNHIRCDVLQGVGGWDPYNVTEDADLGIRLARDGWRSGVLDSETEEEANSDVINWVKQRSRWYKGYLQTWLVHMRRPRVIWQELGPAGFLGFNLFVLGTPLLALVNPVFWTLTLLWFVGQPPFVAMLFPPGLYYVSILTWIFGNFTFLYNGLVVCRGRRTLMPAAFLAPLYWVLMSMAGAKAMLQLVFSPSYWEKTQHGLDSAPAGPTYAVDVAS